MLSLEGAMTFSDCFVKIALTTKLEDEIDVRIGLERINEVDDVSVGSKAAVEGLFLRLLVDSEIGIGIGAGTSLGEALDSNGLIGYKILGLKHHTKRSMVERGDGLITSFEKGTANELVLEAFHGERRNKMFKKNRNKMGIVVQTIFWCLSIAGNVESPENDVEALENA